jgi:CheY-like chemotaxis protein
MPDVLVVDDDTAFVETCAIMLRDRGYEVGIANSVATAKQRLTAATPAAMLLDWRLPDGTCLDILRWLATQLTYIPAALVTGFWTDEAFDSQLKKAQALGACACIRRGVDLADPSHVVNRLLDPLVALHSGVMRGDAMARDRLISIMLATVVPSLTARFGIARFDLASDAVTDAVLQYLREPYTFDLIRHPSFERFIWMRARRHLCNAIRASSRLSTRELEYARRASTVPNEHHPSGRPTASVIHAALRREPDARIRIALCGWLRQQHGPAGWLAIPSIASLPDSKRAAEIKREKDRFVARVKRLWRASLDGTKRRNQRLRSKS